MRVMHVAADLGTYGAERFVAVLLESLGPEPDLALAALTLARARSGDAPLAVARFSAGRSGRYDLSFLGRLAGAMRAWRPDLVHTHTHAGKYWGRLAAILAGVPAIVHTEHNSEFGAPAPFRPLNRLLLRRTDAVIAVSAAQRDRLIAEERIAPERIAVIPNGIPLRPPDPAARERARAQLAAAPGELLVVSVGRLSAVKNQALAIEALALLPTAARLVLIGEGRDRDLLVQLARERGVAERVTFLGYRADAAALVAGADVALLTSRNEAMPLAAIEAMLAGTPVVSTPWRGAAEMLGTGARSVVSAGFSAAATAIAIRVVLDDPAAASARAERAQEFARAEYDIAVTARRHAALYREVIARKRSANPAITAPRS
jgi:glycosyltransferase involved in cell wall biosynthesis